MPLLAVKEDATKATGVQEGAGKGGKQTRDAKAIEGCAPMTKHFDRAGGQGLKVPRVFFFVSLRRHTLVVSGLRHW